MAKITFRATVADPNNEADGRDPFGPFERVMGLLESLGLDIDNPASITVGATFDVEDAKAEGIAAAVTLLGTDVEIERS